MKKQTIRKLVLPCLALALVLCASVAPSLSYFTTYVTAEGGYTIELRRVETDVEETFDGGAKHITVVNTGEVDCYVRVRVFASDLTGLSYSGSGWTLGEDGYWYYDAILRAGATTSELVASITPVEGMNQDYNVIVVEECTAVLYDAAGQPYADWTLTAKEG